MEQVIVETWQIFVMAGAVLVTVCGGLATIARLVSRVRKLLKEREADEQAIRDRAIDAALAKSNVEVGLGNLRERVDAIETWQKGHVDQCTSEHNDIRKAVNESARSICADIEAWRTNESAGRALLHEKINKMTDRAAAIEGSLSTLIKTMGPAK